MSREEKERRKKERKKPQDETVMACPAALFNRAAITRSHIPAI